MNRNFLVVLTQTNFIRYVIPFFTSPFGEEKVLVECSDFTASEAGEEPGMVTWWDLPPQARLSEDYEL